MTIFREWLDYVNMDRLKSEFARLSDREQFILGGIGSALVVLFIGMLMIWAWARKSTLEGDIVKSQKVLGEIATLRVDYDQAKTLLDGLEAVVNRTASSFSLTTFLEEAASRNQIMPDSMSPKPVVGNALYNESQVEVRIQKVTLDNLIDYLYRLENSMEMIRIQSLSVKPNYAEPAYFTVNFVVSVFTGKGQ